MIDDEQTTVLPIRFGPGAAQWPPDTIAWCQRCNQAIRRGQPYIPRIPFRTPAGGYDHEWCPPVLRVVR